jgi:CDP-diacylglycerol--glycerol-3-phosphate 3-phosphatidyltransferase
MRITANQVTLARLVLLPAPVWMLYRGGTSWWIAAFVLYLLLALTDAVDGILARRHGTTALGALLDPVADKIFIVAIFGPLADFQIVSLVLVMALFVRELAVTALRSIAIEERFSFKTSDVAKIKTALQMGGGGFILLIWLVPDRAAILAVLFATTAVMALWNLAFLVRLRWPRWEAAWSLGLTAALAADRALLAPEPAIRMIMAAVLGFTLYSGAEYVWGMRQVLGARFRRHPIELVRLGGLSLAVPLGFLPALAWSESPSFTVLLVLAAEIAAGGLDNSLVQAGRSRGPRPDLYRSAAQLALGGALLLALATGGEPVPVHAFGFLALLLTLGDVLARLLAHTDAFRAVAAPRPAAG